MGTLAQIRRKVRRLTATPDVIQLPDSEIDDNINTAYDLDFPAHLKLFSLHSTSSFFTSPNVDRYDFDVDKIFSINPPVFIAGYQSYYEQDREAFFRIYPFLNDDVDVGTGDGTSGPYNFTLANVPVLRFEFSISAVNVSGVSVSLKDDGDGNLIDATDLAVPPTNRGTIDYVTGIVVITDWGSDIPTTSTINAQFSPYVAARPLAILFYENQFTLRPVPDKAYKVEFEVYRTPTQLLNSESTTELDQWWQYIAFLAAFKILEDRQDIETMAALEPRLDEQKQLVLHRTIIQQTPERVPTIYSEQTGHFYQSGQGNWL